MKKGKPERGREILFGVNPIHEALKVARRKFYGLTLKSGIKQAGAVAEILEIASRRGIPVKFEDIDTVARMAAAAEAFGVAGVIFPDRRAAQYTPVAAKSSAGAGERARLCRVVNVAETVRTLKDEGWRVVALDGEAANEFAPAPGPLALVLGGEGEGARPLVIKRAGETARIPMQGGVGSINVSAAAAIAFYLASRR
ncbi:MAG: RNA methyltransferase [Nitrospinae bacterium]|nr:RNA methyltransferase [Nitrospinota bacterium]